MSATRDQLTAELKRLDGLIPGWLADYGQGAEFWNVVAGETDTLTESASGADAEWANAEFDNLLRKHKVAVPGDEAPVDG